MTVSVLLMAAVSGALRCACPTPPASRESTLLLSWLQGSEFRGQTAEDDDRLTRVLGSAELAYQQCDGRSAPSQSHTASRPFPRHRVS